MLLVDATLASCELTKMAGAQDAPGLGDYLGDPHMSLESLALPTRHENVWLLPAGVGRALATANGARHNDDSAGIASLLDAAAIKFDFVVLAGGSVLRDPLSLGMAPHVGCVLLMAVENQTRVADLDLAQQSLAFCRPRKIGILLTLPLRGNGRAV